MSMARCDDCERVFDSDADPECFVETAPHTYECVCEWCRDIREQQAGNRIREEAE